MCPLGSWPVNELELWNDSVLRTPIGRFLLAVVCVLALALGLSLLGPYPIGGDPDLMYKPIKSELKRSLEAGRLPFWSNRFGIGVPLIAESHVAAFYPPNWPLYRFLDVSTAYKLAMWLHWAALAVSTFAYARVLLISRAGSALAALIFTLCGFQAVHIVHEPFNHLMPYLPLCLLLADSFMRTGKIVWLACLRWPGELSSRSGTSRFRCGPGGWSCYPRYGRHAPPAQAGSECSGDAVDWGSDWSGGAHRLGTAPADVGADRRRRFCAGAHLLAPFSLPPAHWAQFALPEVFLGLHQGTGDTYWGLHQTLSGEACAYSGILGWILAFVGARAIGRSHRLGLWRILVPLSVLLATMPGWWPEGFLLLMKLPGLGWFRAPARYTLLTSFGMGSWPEGDSIVRFRHGGSGQVSGLPLRSARSRGSGRFTGPPARIFRRACLPPRW